jgi:hypothetical protein
MERGKREQPSGDAACDDGSGSGRIFVTDRTSRISFLVDTGADLCVYLRSKLRGPANKDAYELFAANGTRIATYGTTLVSFDLALRRVFKWRFVVADVTTPIIGVVFLSHYGLLVGPRNRRLIDRTTNLSTGPPSRSRDQR